MKKTALIIGATGLIGRALVDELLAKEEITSVITFTRRELVINDEKYKNHVIDFSKLDSYKALFAEGDILFSCLGTTKKQAGSIAEQRKVDLDYQYQAACLAQQVGISQYCLVSSSGANARSLSPYFKMKGELEEKVIALNFSSCFIFQPSLLLGQRQQARTAEGLGAKCLPLLAYLPYLRRYRPIEGKQVANKMAQVVIESQSQDLAQAKVNYYVLDNIF